MILLQNGVWSGFWSRDALNKGPLEKNSFTNTIMQPNNFVNIKLDRKEKHIKALMLCF